MARGKPISDEKRAAVIAALLAGQGVCEVADVYGMPKQTVSRINTSLDKYGLKKEDRLPDLVAQMLEALLDSIIRVAEVTKNEGWLTNQSAENLAVFQGVQADKCFRVLEAAERARLADAGTETGR